MTAIFTGMRASELRGLRWSNVDLKASLIRIRERADRYQKLGPPKSKAGRRDIPLAPLVVNTLKEWRLVCPNTELDLVFPSEQGSVILHTNLLRQGYYPLLRACGLMAKEATDPPYPFHSLRHAAASLFIEAGWGAEEGPGVDGPLQHHGDLRHLRSPVPLPGRRPGSDGTASGSALGRAVMKGGMSRTGRERDHLDRVASVLRPNAS